MTIHPPTESTFERDPAVASALSGIEHSLSSLDAQESELTFHFPKSFELSAIQHAALEDLAAKVPHENNRDLFDLVVAQGIVSVLRASRFFNRPDQDDDVR